MSHKWTNCIIIILKDGGTAKDGFLNSSTLPNKTFLLHLKLLQERLLWDPEGPWSSMIRHIRTHRAFNKPAWSRCNAKALQKQRASRTQTRQKKQEEKGGKKSFKSSWIPCITAEETSAGEARRARGRGKHSHLRTSRDAPTQEDGC